MNKEIDLTNEELKVFDTLPRINLIKGINNKETFIQTDNVHNFIVELKTQYEKEIANKDKEFKGLKYEWEVQLNEKKRFQEIANNQFKKIEQLQQEIKILKASAAFKRVDELQQELESRPTKKQIEESMEIYREVHAPHFESLYKETKQKLEKLEKIDLEIIDGQLYVIYADGRKEACPNNSITKLLRQKVK